jgi:hypothetical protein
LHDTISKPETSSSFAATAKSLVVKDRTQPGNPHGDDIIILDDDGYTD